MLVVSGLSFLAALIVWSWLNIAALRLATRSSSAERKWLRIRGVAGLAIGGLLPIGFFLPSLEHGTAVATICAVAIFLTAAVRILVLDRRREREESPSIR